MAEFLPGNTIRLLNSGGEYFPALLRDIVAAQTEIYLESYIFADDPTGHAVAGELCQAAARGVRVHVTVDGFGARNFKTNFAPRLTTAGVLVLQYRPEISTFHLRRHRLRRLHRKVAVIDGHLAFVGGINIIDDMNAPDHTPPRIDYAVRVQGALLPVIRASVRRLWRRVAWAHLRRCEPGRWRRLRRWAQRCSTTRPSGGVWQRFR